MRDPEVDLRISRRLATSAAVGAAALLVWAAPVSANTVTIGSTLSETSDANTCTSLCTAVQQAQTSNPYPLTSPANGIVTQWAIRSTDEVTYAFRILRPVGSNAYIGAGTALGVDPNSLSNPDAILTYGTSLPIQKGDAIGIGPVAGDIDTGVPQRDTPSLTANVWATNSLGQPADGATATFTPEPGHELLLQATVRYCSVPSLKRLKKTVAKKQLAASDCGVKVKKRPTNKRKFRGKVLKQKVAPGTTAAPGTVVPIVIGRKS